MKLWAVAGILTGLAAISIALKKVRPKPVPIEKEQSPEPNRYDIEELITAKEE